jgi:hypothetical protein
LGEKTTRIDKAKSNKNKKVSYRITITAQQLLIRLTDYRTGSMAEVATALSSEESLFFVPEKTGNLQGTIENEAITYRRGSILI